MKKKGMVVIAGALAVTVINGAVTINAQNKTHKLAVNIPDAGIALALENYDIEDNEKQAELSALIKNHVAAANQSEEFEAAETKGDGSTSGEAAKKEKEPAQQESAKTEAVTEAETVAEEETTTEEETTAKAKSVYDTIAISQVEDYVNVRALPNTDADIVGKIYNNCAATIVATEGEWYKIESGNVTGYIKSNYFVTGEEAKAAAIECGYVNATVTTETLNVRDGQGTDCELLTQLPEGGVFDVVQYGDGWVYLNVDGDVQGWVSMDFVDIDVKFDTAITLEEEQAKIEEEERLAREAEEAERKAREAQEAEEQRRREQAAAEAARRAEEQARQEEVQAAAEQQQAYEEQTYEVTYDTSTSSALRDAVVAYALQFVGNPYVYGGSSLTNGTDCSGFTMSVYAHFGYSLPHQSGSQSGCGVAVSTDSLLPGDLLFYTNGGSSIGHVALYIGGGQVVHASTPATGIKVSSAFYRTPVCAVRIIQ